MARRSAKRELSDWLDRHGYEHTHATKPKTLHPYAVSLRSGHATRAYARKVESPTGHEVFASKERDHHITTHGRQALSADQFALPPGPEEKRRGIKGRLPIDTLKRARNALARARQMQKRRHISVSQLAVVRRKVHAAWPSIDVEGI